MTVIKVESIRTGGITRKIKNLNKWLENPLRKDTVDTTINNLKSSWAKDVMKTFNTRSNMGLRCDNLLAKSLAIQIKGKNKIIAYVEPIVRFSKNTSSSGGPVRNLTAILFRGSKASWGAYSYRWDARTQSNMHPGTSPSKMRHFWEMFRVKLRENIREALNRSLRKTMGKS